MPELPEVETIARSLRPRLLGKTILKADVRWARTLALPSGDLQIKSSRIKPQKHDRLILALSGGKSLVFNETRKFGRVWLTTDAGQILGHLGPEPLSDAFTAKWLHESLQSRHRQLKPLLLDQSFIAGLGNIYTDEVLHRAKLHPRRSSESVTAAEARKLYKAIGMVLEDGILRNGASIDWVYRGGDYQNHFRVYDRKGQPCPVCGTPIQRILVGQRSTYFCPSCQLE